MSFRYCNLKCKASKEIISTFYLLIDLMTFFDYYYNQQYNEALDVSCCRSILLNLY